MYFEQCKRIKSLMADFDKTWFFAGGWAIDLFVDKETRAHNDIEFAVFRKDQQYLKDYLKQWEFLKVIKGELHSWENEFLDLPIHELYASNMLNGDCIEILLNDTEGDYWIFRRDLRISYPLNSIWNINKIGIPYLKPEIVLLYKAKNTRKKDHQDFITVKDSLDKKQKKWLQNALEIHEPEHYWLKLLN